MIQDSTIHIARSIGRDTINSHASGSAVSAAGDTVSYFSAMNDTIHHAMGDTVVVKEHMLLELDKVATGYEGDRMPFMLEHVDGIFALLLLCFLLFAYLGGFGFIKENFKLLFSKDKNDKIQSDLNIKDIFSSLFLILQTVILVSISIYAILSEYYAEVNPEQPLLMPILSFVAAISLFFIVKVLIYRFIGYIFDIQNLIRIWVRTYIVLLEFLGIIYFAPTLLLIYGNFLHAEIALLMLIIFIISQILLFCRIVVFFIREKFNFLYLIAYLCSIEILPYLLLAGALVYLYETDVLSLL